MSGRPRHGPKGSLAKAQAAHVQNYELTELRAAQLEADVGPLSEAIRDLSRRLRFEDQPSDFRAALLRERSRNRSPRR